MTVGRTDPQRQSEAIRQAILGAAGDNHEAAHRLLNDYDDAVREEEHQKFTQEMRHLGHFLEVYGVPEVWTVLWLRFGCEISRHHGWTLGGGGFYKPGDEWRFVHGDKWQPRAEAGS